MKIICTEMEQKKLLEQLCGCNQSLNIVHCNGFHFDEVDGKCLKEKIEWDIVEETSDNHN